MPGLPPANPSLLVVVAGALVSIAVMASLFPARRAAQVDPMEALRNE